MQERMLRDVFANVLVFRVGELANVAVKDYFSVAQNQETHWNIAILSTRQSTQLVGSRIKLMRSHGECILQAVGDEQRTGPVNVALLHNQFNNRVGRDRIETASG